jgi:hypothetical protein
MASTFSTNLKFELIGAGEQAGAWNNTTNTNIGTLIEQAICGVQDIALSGTADYPLLMDNGAESDARNMVLILGGSPTGSCNVIARDVDKVYIVRNATAYSHTIKTTSGSGVSIPANSSALVFCDSTGDGTIYNAIEDLAAGASIAGAEIVTTSGTQTLTNKTLTAPKFADLGFIADANGNELMIFDTVTSAVNEVTLANSITGNGPILAATGGDTNIDLNLVSKGTGLVKVGGVEVVTLSGTQALSNKTIVSPANISATTGNAAIVAATGPDTDININLTPKGAGVVNTTTVATFAAGTVTAPSIAATGDLNTGIFFPAANSIAFTTDGTEDFRLGPLGQFGIGGANYGTAGQVLASGGASAAPAWTTLSASGVPDVIIEDQKTSGTGGGTGTENAWTTRTLNTLYYNRNSLASLSSNQFTLPAGTYYINARSPINNSDSSYRIRLYNVTSGSVERLGDNAYTLAGSSPNRPNQIDATLDAVVTIAGSTAFRIEYYVYNFSNLTGANLGVSNSLGTEIYTSVKIWKI